MNNTNVPLYKYSTVLEKVNFAHRARNAFEREPSEREGPNFSKASSIERDHSKSSRASSSARLSREICNFQFVVSSIRKFMEVSKCNVSAMFVFPIHLYQFIHYGKHLILYNYYHIAILVRRV